MTKKEYLSKLQQELGNIPKSEAEKCIAYYDEIISDYMEDGLYEEEAVARLDSPLKAAAKFRYELPLFTLIKSNVHVKKAKANTLFLILGFPLWFPLVMAFSAIILSVYITIWSLNLVLYACLFAFTVGGGACVVYSVVSLFLAQGLSYAAVLFGSGFVLIALGLFLIVFAKKCTVGLIKLSKLFTKLIKSLFIRKAVAE